jgi:hypothetical protein
VTIGFAVGVLSFLVLLVAVPAGLEALDVASSGDRSAAAGADMLLVVMAPFWIPTVAGVSIFIGIAAAAFVKGPKPPAAENQKGQSNFQRNYVHRDIVKAVRSASGKSKIEFLRRYDGLYEYRAYDELIDDTGPYGRRPYWAPTAHSGLYQTLEELERTARQAVPWLGEAN